MSHWTAHDWTIAMIALASLGLGLANFALLWVIADRLSAAGLL